MLITHLEINNFKNITEASFDFNHSLNCLLGNNGMGKSNLLDAIYFLSYCRSFSGITDKGLLNYQADFFSLRGEYLRNGVGEALTIGMNSGHRKILKRKGKEYKRLSEHIGQFPLVMVAPRDASLITGSGEERRRFMDMIISQSSPAYLDALIRYQRSLEQRNRLLRADVTDTELYDAVEVSLVDAATNLHSARTEWIPLFEDIFRRYYAAIAGPGESVSLTFKAHLSRNSGNMRDLLDSARRHDMAVGYTSVGPHRDDIEVYVNTLEARHTASQGQCKTITVAMRLAQFEFLRQATGLTPLLLLDDIFDKLDATRVERIVDIVGSDRFGQIFITDTNRSHLDAILRDNTSSRAIWNVNNGSFTLSH